MKGLSPAGAAYLGNVKTGILVATSRAVWQEVRSEGQIKAWLQRASKAMIRSLCLILNAIRNNWRVWQKCGTI